jgi:replicative DNA helicase
MNLPEDFEAERSIIATLAQEGSLTPGAGSDAAHRAVLLLGPHMFVSPEHQAIFAAIKVIYQRGDVVAPLVIKAEMSQSGTLERLGGWLRLVDILSGEETGRPDRLAEIVISRWQARQVIQISHKAAQAVQDLETPEAVSSRIQTALAKLFSGGTSEDVRCGTEILGYLHENRPFRDPSRQEKLVWMGLAAVDQVVEAAPGHVVIIAARPGIGKTALAIQGSIITAGRDGVPLIVSLEMDHDEVFSRLAARLCDIPASVFRQGTWNAHQGRLLASKADILGKIQIWAHPSGVAWERVETVIRDQVRRNHVSSVWIDYFTLIRKPDGKSNDSALWGEVSSSIKRLAQELGICIVLLCQLNREGDAVEPKLSDLRETGQLEQDANAVLMLWPKDLKAMESPVEVKTIFSKLAKNRSGQAGWRVELAFNGATGCIRAIERTT